LKNSEANKNYTLENVIAVIGSDGAGKSTLTLDLVNYLKQKQEAELVYLGQASGAIGDWIQNLKFFGPVLARYLKSKANKVHNKKDQAPDILTAVVIYLLSRWRVHKFKRVLRLNKKGVIVVTDRYPQAEVAGFYFDGTGLGVIKAKGFFVRMLEKKERQLYQWMARYLPALIIRLDVDAKTAQQRKPDHKLKMLEQKTSVIPTLKFNGATILDLDSTAPYEDVLASAKKAIEAIT